MHHHHDFRGPHDDQFPNRHMRGRRGHRFGGFPGPEDDGPGGFGGEFRLKRILRGADLRLVVLLLIEEAPRHGYDLIKAIEEKSAEAYSPSPGVIYPALTFLEEAGYAGAEMDGAKKVYAITEAGSAYLDDNRAEAEAALETLVLVGKRAAAMREHLAERHGYRDRDIPGVLPEVNEARRALKSAIASAVSGDEATQRRVAEILNRAAEDIGKLDIDL
jgi:DNA-binding PadR family transcriptional regulator